MSKGRNRRIARKLVLFVTLICLVIIVRETNERVGSRIEKRTATVRSVRTLFSLSPHVHEHSLLMFDVAVDNTSVGAKVVEVRIDADKYFGPVAGEKAIVNCRITRSGKLHVLRIQDLGAAYRP